MTSIKHWIGGYLKQLLGELVGSPSLHEAGKREVLGLPEEECAEAIATSVPDVSAVTGQPVNPAPMTPRIEAHPRRRPPSLIKGADK